LTITLADMTIIDPMINKMITVLSLFVV